MLFSPLVPITSEGGDDPNTWYTWYDESLGARIRVSLQTQRPAPSARALHRRRRP